MADRLRQRRLLKPLALLGEQATLGAGVVTWAA